MEKELLDDLASLRDALKGDPRVLALDQAEKALTSSPEVIELAKKKDAAERDYEDCLNYHKETDPEALALQKALYQAKLALDEHPLSKAYNAAYIPSGISIWPSTTSYFRLSGRRVFLKEPIDAQDRWRNVSLSGD
jgi:hypothetical protein